MIKSFYYAKDIIKIFGIEIILLWTALMMKKRVVVYCDKSSTLLRVIRSFPLFIWHRRDDDLLYPFNNMVSKILEFSFKSEELSMTSDRE